MHIDKVYKEVNALRCHTGVYIKQTIAHLWI